jgi:HEAT repeats
VDDRQLDLFAPTRPAAAASTSPHRPALDPALLDDAALIAALPDANLQDCVALAAEAGRRRVSAALPALARLCKRFAGWGIGTVVPEQVAALDALTRIGGRAAATIVADGIARAEFVGPTLVHAVAAAAALETKLPEDVVLQLLRHDNPRLRADSCRCVRASPPVIALLIDLLDDLHPEVCTAAAIALGMLGRREARPLLKHLLQETPTPEIVSALAGIADDECLVLLRRLAQHAPALTEAVIDALEMSDHPRAAAIAATLQAPA